MSHKESLVLVRVGQVRPKAPGRSEMAFLYSVIADA